ncbi:hypothetical protein FD754_015809 [Muntiacus muntjak]|uniref:Uncharacterized protein n=1 Tax=Muntiacus muntjak TaxID=9888 RepID=A0A5N3VPA5_MUNMU|nr:hypothetical protein FD754_015809 [Muntiacus muntjak]
MPRLDTGDLYVWWLSGESEQLPHITGLREVLLTCVPERTCDLCSLQQGSTQSWTVAASETVSLLQNFASFLPPGGLYALSHSLGSKLQESKSSLYPNP